MTAQDATNSFIGLTEKWCAHTLLPWLAVEETESPGPALTRSALLHKHCFKSMQGWQQHRLISGRKGT